MGKDNMFNNIKKIILIILGSFLFIYIVLTLAFPNRMIHIVGFRTFIVISPSMEPEIMVHDMILITKVDENELDEGDIVTFKAYIPELQDYSYVTHYLVKIEDGDNGTIYKTQGANKVEDDFDEWTDENNNPIDIKYEDIEGVYTFTVPLLGPLIHRLQDPIFIGLLAVNGTIIYFLFKISNSYIKDKKEKKEIE